MQYGHFGEGYFPKVGKLQKLLIPYREMVKRRHKDLSQSRLEAATVYHLRCAGYLRSEVEEEMQRHTPRPAHPDELSSKIGSLQRILDYAFGANGDILVINQKLSKPDVEKFNKEAEVIDYYMKYQQEIQCKQYIQNRLKIR